MDRRTSIKSILAASFFVTSFYSSCKWIGNNPEQFESIYLYKDLIAELAETIIPATDSPGAKDAKVEEFIIEMMVKHESKKSQKRFLKGLINLQEYSKNNYNCNFQNCSLIDKINILNYYEKKDISDFKILAKIENRIFGDSFIHKLKNLTVIGFCTSKIGATEALAYDYVPINYNACVPLKEGQKSWATN